MFIVLGVLAYLGLRQLPPDNSLARVRAAGVLNVCAPPSLPPFVSSDGTTATGSEAAMIDRVARRLGVPVGWNVQPAWGTSPDPVDWGVRPESCDLLAGGIVVNAETQGLMQVMPYARRGWAQLSTTAAPKRLAVLTNHWGLAADDAFGWADARGVDFVAVPSADAALAALTSGERDSVLGLADEVAWLHARVPGSVVTPVRDLPTQTLALGMWKNTITLKRVVTSVLNLQPNGR
ncbi:ABC-type amino acid transport substrate-binding protein [Deinococcus metalli]|uniref:ABC-type amino acid transport substrate-binding protein n=1 Tax=Deinococcus metalli TaxID=1141878 RepID=A0A7W8KAX9_9DEIO|nr:transporter substrate-binding domain-containing protein [Deinococcus metalli]MBB5374912.1 ABC-type amino acid transport substrate-binding protein [Deinococcus metalli]GHF32777.1 hypothetical protein GCM10017781_06850 [Deinococcus metalli]